MESGRFWEGWKNMEKVENSGNCGGGDKSVRA